MKKINYRIISLKVSIESMTYSGTSSGRSFIPNHLISSHLWGSRLTISQEIIFAMNEKLTQCCFSTKWSMYPSDLTIFISTQISSLTSLFKAFSTVSQNSTVQPVLDQYQTSFLQFLLLFKRRTSLSSLTTRHHTQTQI